MNTQQVLEETGGLLTLNVQPARQLEAILELDDSLIRNGERIPVLSHWAYHQLLERQSNLGPNGHAAHASVEGLTRRLWAGYRVKCREDLRFGDVVACRESEPNIKLKEGASGPIAFVTFQRTLGRVGEEPALVEEHDAVLIGSAPTQVRHTSAPSLAVAWTQEIVTDPVLLFRYSALMLNAHRIHYDHLYATEVEGYPALVVHAPLIALYLTRFASRWSGMKSLRSFAARAVSPGFVGSRIRLCGTTIDRKGASTVWATADDGRLLLTGDLVLA